MGVAVKLRGIPYRSAPQEIEAFFAGYGFIPESVKIGQDPDGRSSGEAWISFGTDEEARRAVNDRNRQHLGNRYVELFVEAA